MEAGKRTARSKPAAVALMATNTMVGFGQLAIIGATMPPLQLLCEVVEIGTEHTENGPACYGTSMRSLD